MFTLLYGRLRGIFGCKLSISQRWFYFAYRMFYVFRGLARVASGGVATLTMIIVSNVVTLQQQGKYKGISGVFMGLGDIVGPFIGVDLL
ncbi:uncharacterized protein BJX67DRAFT_366370 [Aspergillus lucknowensis]|uniref:Major facilitator superfamily (MFS) profile domain-containing protein n=1 Tax=Aspergillus lucknowensis TaxID=176173 RepID=A0ABR4LCX5_9EURO